MQRARAVPPIKALQSRSRAFSCCSQSAFLDRVHQWGIKHESSQDVYCGIGVGRRFDGIRVAHGAATAAAAARAQRVQPRILEEPHGTVGWFCVYRGYVQRVACGSSQSRTGQRSQATGCCRLSECLGGRVLLESRLSRRRVKRGHNELQRPRLTAGAFCLRWLTPSVLSLTKPRP